VCIASCDSVDKYLKMTDQYSKHVAYVIALCNKVVVLTYIIILYSFLHSYRRTDPGLFMAKTIVKRN